MEDMPELMSVSVVAISLDIDTLYVCKSNINSDIIEN